MSLTESQMLELGTPAPGFSLPDTVSGQTISLDTYADKDALLVMFICAHCPFVLHEQHEIAKLGRDFANSELGIVAISSNSVITHPRDSPENLKAMAERLDFQFPFCYDASQDVAKSYTAACTPDFFLFDKERKLAYRGQLDDSRPESGKPVTGADLRAAIAAVLAGEPVAEPQKPSVGCNIKWAPGNAPAYFG